MIPIPDRQRAARQRIDRLFEMSHEVFAIHYSCESLDLGDTSPRITSIALRSLDRTKEQYFSIQKEAEARACLTHDIGARIDELERAMLNTFTRFVENNNEVQLLHWKMRNSFFGFAALNERYEALGGNAFRIPSDRRTDLADVLSDIYGDNYIGDPKLSTLAHKNRLTLLGFIPGKEEPALFASRDFQRLRQSTLRKVELCIDIAERVKHRTLTTNSNWFAVNIGWPKYWWRRATENKDLTLFVAIVSLILGILGFRH